MASGVGVTYELNFKLKDNGAKKMIDSMHKHAERLAKALDKISLKHFDKQIQNMKKHLQSQGDTLKNQLKMTQDMMKSLGGEKNVKAGLDQVKKQAEQAKKATEQLNQAKEEVGKPVNNPYENVEKGAERAKQAAENLKKVKEARDHLGNKVMDGAKDFIMKAGQEALQQYGDTDYELRGASAKTGGYGVHLKQYRDLAKKVGGATKFNNLDVAKAINSGATLGIKAEEMKKIIPVSADLAQAFNVEIPKALEMTKMHMNSYQLSAESAERVTDMIAVTSKNTAADIDRLNEGFRYSGASAKALGVPMETLYALIGKLNDNGLTGSTAGTGINQIFESMKDFKKRDKLEQLIGKVTDEKGNLQDVTQILERLKKTTDKMGNADKAGILKAIFGVQGGRAVNTLLNGSIENLKKLENQIKNSAGTAKQLSKFMMMGSAGAVETLMGTMSSTFASIFDSLEPLLVPVAGMFLLIAESIGKVAEKAPWLLQLVTILGSMIIGAYIFEQLKQKISVYVDGIKQAIIQTSILKIVLMGLLAIGLIVIFNMFKQWQEYLQQNADVNKVWEATLQSLTEVLGVLGTLVMQVLGAIFGFEVGAKKADDTTKIWGMSADEVKQKLEDFKKGVEEFSEKVEKMTEWVDKNKDKVKLWGQAFIGLAVGIAILKGLSAAQAAFNAVAAMNPYVAIAMAIIAAIMLIWWGLKWLYENVDWFRAGVDTAWKSIKEGISIAVEWIGEKFEQFKQWLKEVWDENENLRTSVDIVWTFMKDHMEVTVGFIVAGPIGALIGGLIELYNENENVRAVVDSVWSFIGSHIEAVVGFIIGGPIGLFIGALLDLRSENEAARPIIDGVWQAIQSVVGAAIDNIIGFITNAIGAVNSLIGAFGSLLSLDWDGVGRNLQNLGGNIVGMHKSVISNHPVALGAKGISGFNQGYGASKARGVQLQFEKRAFPSQVKARGTDNFMAGHSNGWTTTDEHGDEAIWLPNGSMIARNTTTRDILNNMKAIKNNTKGSGAGKSENIVNNHNTFVFNVNSDEAKRELMRELENLGIA